MQASIPKASAIANQKEENVIVRIIPTKEEEMLKLIIKE
jgi:hypothetical protein